MDVIVYSVLSVECKILKSKPPQLSVKAVGETPSPGYTNPRLLPWIYLVPPADGILDLTFTAEAPVDGGNVTTVLTPITVNPPPFAVPSWVTGVRVHSATNKMEGGVKIAGDDDPFPQARKGDEDPYPLKAPAWAVGKAA